MKLVGKESHGQAKSAEDLSSGGTAFILQKELTVEEAAQHVIAKIENDEFGAERVRMIAKDIDSGYILKDPAIVGSAFLAINHIPGQGDVNYHQELQDRFELVSLPQMNKPPTSPSLVEALGKLVMKRVGTFNMRRSN